MNPNKAQEAAQASAHLLNTNQLMKNRMKKYLEIIQTATGEVVKRIDLTDVSERRADRIEMGANINLNGSEYHTEQNEYEIEMPLNFDKP